MISLRQRSTILAFRMARAGLAIALPWWLARIWSLRPDLGGATLLAITRGFTSDLAVAMVLALAVAWCGRRGAKAALMFSAWFAACNVEHILVNFANADLAFLHYGLSREFLRGSVLNLSIATKFVGLAVPSLLILAGSEAVRRRRPQLALGLSRAFNLMGALSAFAVIFVAPPFDQPRWLGENVAEENLVRFAERWWQSPPRRSPLRADLQRDFFSLDLDGQTRLTPQPHANVLLIVIEGLGRDDFEAGHFPRLRERARDGWLFSHLIDDQKQTDNGLYSLLCGDYPNLTSKESKASWMATYGAPHDCLPKNLKAAGYRSAFLQGAPLGFMRKDKFAAAAGFDLVRGADDFTHALSRNGWGVDDQTLFNAVDEQIRTWERAPAASPWFMSLLTSGTHHPYNVPSSALSADHVIATVTDAQTFADRALDQTLNALKARGALKDTLVLITGDEATPVYEPPGVHGELGYNRSFLIALTPDHARGETAERFLQSDLQASVDDYVGAAGARLGRSLFRTYSRPRDLLFSNVFVDRVYRRSEASAGHPAQLLTCSFDFQSCETYLVPAGHGTLANSPREISELQALTAFNDLTSEQFRSGPLFEERNTDYQGSPYLLGSFRALLQAEDHLKWTVRLKADDHNRSGTTVLLQAYRPNDQSTFIQQSLINDATYLAPGQVLEVERTHRVFAPQEWIWTNLRLYGAANDIVHVEELAIRRETAGARRPAADHAAVLDDGGAGDLDLLAARPLNACLGLDAETPRPSLEADHCPRAASLLAAGPTRLRKGRTESFEVEVEVLSGEISFGVSLDEDHRPLAVNPAQKLRAGERRAWTVTLRSPLDHATSLNSSLVILDATSGARFLVRRAVAHLR